MSVAEEADVPRRAGWAGVDLGAMWDGSRPILEEQLNVVERAVVAAIERRLSLAGQVDAGREAHKLAGSLGTFGFHDGSRLAQELELALTSTALIDPGQALALSGRVVDLRVELARPVRAGLGAAGAERREGEASPLIVVGADADWARRVVEVAVARGLQARATTDLDLAVELAAEGMPDAVAVDSSVAGPNELAAFLDILGDLATVVVADPGEWVGAQAVLTRPAPPDAVVDAVTRLLAGNRATATVLAVDDDPTFLLIISALLGAEGLAVETLADAGELWSTLERVTPDLLLLDNQMPGLDGISVCRAVRSDERWARLPVVFLSASHAPEVVRGMFAAGADDFVAKPVTPEDLVARVINRITRSRVQSDRSSVDPATGLPDARRFAQDADRLLGLARRSQTPAALALVTLDPPDAAQLRALGRLLRRTAEAGDAVGSWSGGRLAALFYGATGADAQSRVEDAMRAARASGSTATAIGGVAARPEDGDDVPALSAAAEVALGRARMADADAVLRHTAPGQGGAEVVDVLLVDDDEALGALVVHALGGRGWTVRWLRDGAEAVDLLDDPLFRARVVMLDVGLPGLDGIAVLRHAGRRGLLAGTRVVMLTVRSNEAEVLEALDLGAFDHVGKPFSLPVLLHRVRRALETNG